MHAKVVYLNDKEYLLFSMMINQRDDEQIKTDVFNTIEHLNDSNPNIKIKYKDVGILIENDTLVFENNFKPIEKIEPESEEIKPLTNADVDNIREYEYSLRVSKFLQEAEIKKHQGLTHQYNALMDKAVLERKKIQEENPWLNEPS